MKELIETKNGIKEVTIKLSDKAKQEIEDIRNKIRGDMTDEQWERFKSIRV